MQNIRSIEVTEGESLKKPMAEEKKASPAAEPAEADQEMLF